MSGPIVNHKEYQAWLWAYLEKSGRAKAQRKVLKTHRALVAEWAKHCDVSVPTVELHDVELCTAWYTPLEQQIMMPVYFHRGCTPKDILMHEFAHHLNREEPDDPFVPLLISAAEAHDEVFFEHLAGLAELVYADPTRYNWCYHEYPHITAWAANAGLIPEDAPPTTTYRDDPWEYQG